MTRHQLFRASGDEKCEIFYNLVSSKFGRALVAWQGSDKICHLSFIDDDAIEEHLQILQEQWPNGSIKKKDHHLTHIFDIHSSLNLLIKASELQFAVWQALLTIPYGNIVSYSDVAVMIEKPKAIRAVASCIAQNNIAYLIPCHRVVRKSGEIGQYRWNSERKKSMLLQESQVS